MINNYIYNNEKKNISLDFLYIVDGYITYNVTVFVEGFSGHCSFCLLKEKINETVLKIDTMHKLLNGKITIEDTESDAFLEIEFENDMKLFIRGQIGSSYDDNLLKFKLEADQTVLINLKNALLSF